MSAAALAVIPGRPDRIAVYLYLPVWHVVGGPYRARQTLGLALYDPIAGTRVFMPEPAINVPAVRSLFAGPEGVMPAGLDQPLLLRRFEIHGDRVGPWTDSAPNHHVELSESRWRDPSYFGDRIIDSAGVLLDGAGTELDLLNASDPVRTEGFAADPDGDRFYGAIDHGVEAFDAATHRSIAYMEVWATRTDPYPHPSDRMLWLGDRRLALLRRAEDAASYAITVFQSDGVAP